MTGVLLREPMVDFQNAHDAGLAGVEDPIVLAKAAFDDRILVSSDRRTMPAHFARFLLQSDSPGVIIVPQNLAISVAIYELVLIWAASEHEEWANSIRNLPL